MVKLFFVAVCALVLFVQSNARNMPMTTLSDKTPATVDVATTTVRSGGAGFKEEKINFIPVSGVGLTVNLGEDIGAGGAGGGQGGAGGGADGGAGGLGGLGGDDDAVKGGVIGGGIIDP